MDIEKLMNVINSLSAIGYESGYVSFRSDKGIIISPDKEFFKISDADIEIVGKERNVNKEKAIHLTAYEKIADINAIIHVYPEYVCKLAAVKRAIYPYSATDARAIGAKLCCVLDNLYQISDSLKSSRAALTPVGLFVAGATAEEVIERVEMIERAAKIEYLIHAEIIVDDINDNAITDKENINADKKLTAINGENVNSEVNEKANNKTDNAEKRNSRPYKPHKLGYFTAKSIERAYLLADRLNKPSNNSFVGGYGYYSRLDNGVLCASDVNSGEEIILNAKTAKNKIFKLLLSLYDGEYQGAAVIYNGENAVIVAGYNDTEFMKIDRYKSDLKGLADSILDKGYILINGYGVLALGEDVDSAIVHAKEIDDKCSEYIAHNVIAI